MKSLIDESNKNSNWIEPEWEVPKGRRNLNESDIDCALREFTEETGYKGHNLTHIDNLMYLKKYSAVLIISHINTVII